MSLGRSPQEFADRVVALAEGRIEPMIARAPIYDSLAWHDAQIVLERSLGPRFEQALNDPALDILEADMRATIEEMSSRAPFSLLHNADFNLARCCYAVARAVEPDLAVETGVGYGVTTTFLLAAMAANGKGQLHSIDLPPLDFGSEKKAGMLIPNELRTRWTLHRGMSRRILPQLLRDLNRIDLFLHDSLHTDANMRFEFDMVWPRLRRGGAVIADDVELNGAFNSLRQRARQWVAIRQATKSSLFGIATR